MSGKWICHICGRSGLNGRNGFSDHYMLTHWVEPPWDEVISNG